VLERSAYGSDDSILIFSVTFSPKLNSDPREYLGRELIDAQSNAAQEYPAGSIALSDNYERHYVISNGNRIQKIRTQDRTGISVNSSI